MRRKPLFRFVPTLGTKWGHDWGHVADASIVIRLTIRGGRGGGDSAGLGSFETRLLLRPQSAYHANARLLPHISERTSASTMSDERGRDPADRSNLRWLGER